MRISIDLIERKTVQSQNIAKKKGKTIVKDVTKALSQIPWRNVARSTTFPVSLPAFTKFLAHLTKEFTKVTQNDLRKFTHFATNFWDYIDQIDPNEKKVYLKLRSETSTLSDLWDRYDTSSSVAVKWLGNAMVKVTKSLADLQRTTMMNMGYITGSILEEWFYSGQVFATETILYSFMAMLELTISTPSFESNYMRSVGVELFHYLNGIPKEKYEFVKDVSLGDFEGTHKDAISWVAHSMKSLPMVVLIGLHNIMLRCIESLQTIMNYMTQLFDTEFKENAHDLEVSELKRIATGMIQNNLVSEDKKDRLKFAIKQVDRVEKYIPKPGVVSPHLVALLLRQLYYGEEPDKCVGKDILKQRFGETAENVISGALESYELLRLEIELAFVTKDENTPQSVEGGFGDWCGRKKETPDDPKGKEEETDEERDTRLRNARFERKAHERRLYALTIDQRSLEEHRKRLEDELATRRIEKEREIVRVTNAIRDINNSNIEVNKEVNRVQLVEYKTGKTVALKEAGKAVRGFGEDAKLAVLKDSKEIQEEIDQIEWELRYIDSRIVENRNVLTQSEKRWTRNILMVCGIGMLIYFAWNHFSSVAEVTVTSWEMLEKEASASSSNSIFFLLKTQYEEFQRVVGGALPKEASAMALHHTAGRILNQLNTYTQTDKIAFKNFIDKFGQTIQSIMLETNNADFKQLAVMANENIYKAFNAAEGDEFINAQTVALKSVQKVLTISVEGLMNGHLPSNLSNLVSTLASVKDAAIAGLSGIWSNWKPSPSTYTSIHGLLQLSATRASKGFVDSVGKQLTSQFTTIFGVFIIFIIMVAGFSRIFAIVGSSQYDTVIESGRVFTGTLIAAGSVFDVIVNRITEATVANNTVYWETLQSLVAPFALAAVIAGYFSPWGWLTSGVSRASTAYGNWVERRGIQQKQQQQTPALPAPSPQQQTPALPSPETTTPAQRRSIHISLTDKEAKQLAYKVDQRIYNPPVEKKEEESESDDDTSSGLRSNISCVICAEQAKFICSHCNNKGYCNKLCAQLDWSKQNKDHISF
jgi:hypothetical protein